MFEAILRDVFAGTCDNFAIPRSEQSPLPDVSRYIYTDGGRGYSNTFPVIGYYMAGQRVINHPLETEPGTRGTQNVSYKRNNTLKLTDSR